MSLQTYRKLVINSLQGLVLFVLVAAAVYVSIGRILTSTVNLYRESIQRIVSEQLHVPFEVAEITGSWDYLDPSLKLLGASIGNAVEPAVVLREIELRIDTVASLKERSLVVSALDVRGLRLELVRDTNGSWVVKGMPPAKEPLDLSVLLDSVPYLGHISISDIEIGMDGHRTDYLVKSHPQERFELSVEQKTRTLVWPLTVTRSDKPEEEMEILFSGYYQGDPREDDFDARFYLQLPTVEVIEYLPATEIAGYHLDQVLVSGDFWFEWRDSKGVIEGVPRIERAVAVKEDTSLELVRNLEVEFAATASAEQGGTAFLNVFEGRLAGVSWQLPKTSISYLPGTEGLELAVHLAEIPLEKVTRTLLKLAEVPGLLPETTGSLVQDLSPSGRLSDINLSLLIPNKTSQRKSEMAVATNLRDVSIHPYKGAPGVEHLNGFMSLTPTSGYIDVLNDKPLTISFSLFDDSWSFEAASSRVRYETYDQGVFIFSDYVRLTQDELEANGGFFVNINKSPLLNNWGLEIGVQRAQLLQSSKYLPNTLPEEVSDWLENAILGGYASESGMVFHGSLAKQAPKDQKAHELYFKVSETILDYDPNWPRVNDLSGTVYVGNRVIHSDDAVGTIYDSEIVSSEVSVPMDAEGKADSILIDGALEGTFSDGLRVLTETPLYDITSRMASHWVGDGDVKGTAGLNIPIGDRAKAGDVIAVDVALELSNTNVQMTDWNLEVFDINGDFRYQTELGISSDAFTARVFDEPVAGNMMTSGSPEIGVIHLNMNGAVAIRDLYEWSDQVILSRASGKADYQSVLTIPYGGSTEDLSLVARSNLQGVSIHLPEPMGKTDDTEKRLYYSQTFLQRGDRIEIGLGDRLKSSLKIIDGDLIGGRIHFGLTDPGAVAYDRLRVTGELEWVQYEEWDRLSSELDKRSDTNLEAELAGSLNSIDLHISQLDLYGFDLESVNTYITRSKGSWDVALNNEMLEGTVIVPDDDLKPLGIDLARIAFVSTDIGDEKEGLEDGSLVDGVEGAGVQGVDEDPLGELKPSELFSANIRLDDMLIDGDSYGSWAFNFRPDATEGDRAILSNLEARVKGLEIKDAAGVIWERKADGSHMTQFDGQILVPNLAAALKAWGFASSIEGENFDITANVSWPGSPAMVDLETIAGKTRLNSGKGRFVQADNNMGALRLLGIFDFASLARRFRFDFSDVVKSGFTFSKIEGETRFNHGIIDVVDPIRIVGSGSTFKVGGTVDITTRELDNDMIVTLPVNRNLPWYAAYSALATGPLAGATVFIAQKVFQNQIEAISSAKYKITGTVDEPVVEFVSIFSDSVREIPEAPPTGE